MIFDIENLLLQFIKIFVMIKKYKLLKEPSKFLMRGEF